MVSIQNNIPANNTYYLYSLIAMIYYVQICPQFVCLRVLKCRKNNIYMDFKVIMVNVCFYYIMLL